jgi:F-type H+-transporting ATPase subunit epsilon
MQEESETVVALIGGFIEVKPDKITILAGSAELACEIDYKRAEAAKCRAENLLREKTADIDSDRAEVALKRALIRLKVAEQGKMRE